MVIRRMVMLPERSAAVASELWENLDTAMCSDVGTHSRGT